MGECAIANQLSGNWNVILHQATLNQMVTALAATLKHRNCQTALQMTQLKPVSPTQMPLKTITQLIGKLIMLWLSRIHLLRLNCQLKNSKQHHRHLPKHFPIPALMSLQHRILFWNNKPWW